MEKIPLNLRLKRETHRNIAYAQDLIVNEVYKKIGKAVLHGGTAIWRCYSGKRFSEDLDFYFPKDEGKIQEIFSALESRGFKILKKKISSNSVYSELQLDRTSVRLEATFQNIPGILADYENVDGTIISIYSLSPERFVEEKTATYLKRFKIRDLWNVFFLLKITGNSKELNSRLKKLIQEYKPPIDEGDLKLIVFEGIVPSSHEMLEYIKRKWEKENI